MEIVLDNGEIVNSTLPLPTHLTRNEIRAILGKPPIEIELAKKAPKKSLVRAYDNMKKRCYNKNHISYKYYGKKGVSICQDWYTFKNFYMWSIEHGYKLGYILDRIDSTSNYTPMNCQWISKSKNNVRKKYDYFYKGGCQS